MIIAQTPLRMSFFGGGTDYSDFFREYGGSVLSTSFDKYTYVTVQRIPHFFDYKTQVAYGKQEYVNSIDEIQHPTVRESMRFLDMKDLRIVYAADLPARTGIGSSSSFCVGLLNAFHALRGEYADKRQLADESIHVERDMCAESGGWQDQIAVSFGGLNRIDFTSNGYQVQPVIISNERKEALNRSQLLYFTGFTRYSHQVAEAQMMVNKTKSKVSELLQMRDMVGKALGILAKGDLDDFGYLLDHAWKLKRGLTSQISSSSIDAIYEKALKCGALGGKLLGAGGGGFILFYVPEEKQPQFKKDFSDLLYVPFQFEDNGTRILYYKAND